MNTAIRRAAAVVGVLGSFNLASCAKGFDNDSNRSVVPADSSVDSAGSSSPRSTTPDVTTTTEFATTSTSVEPELSDLVLRGDGLGLLPFGTPQEAVVATLTSMLGTPGADSGPPWAMATPPLNGCANRADTAMAFSTYATTASITTLLLVVGFTDQGNGPVLTAWTAVQNGFPVDQSTAPTLATEEGLAVGDAPDDAATIYGDAFHPQATDQGWEWFRGLKPAAVVDSEGGQIMLAPLVSDDDHLYMFSAGTPCTADPLDVVSVGDRPIGLTYSVISRGDPAAPARVIVQPSNHHPTEWFEVGGGCMTVDCSSAVTIVGQAGQPTATAIWATRRADPIGGLDVWEVTDIYVLPGGAVLGAAQDCGAGTFPLANADGTVVVLSLDAAGAIVAVPIERASCVEIIG